MREGGRTIGVGWEGEQTGAMEGSKMTVCAREEAGDRGWQMTLQTITYQLVWPCVHELLV